MTPKTPAQVALEQARIGLKYSRETEIDEADKKRTALMEFAVAQHEAKVKAEETK